MLLRLCPSAPPRRGTGPRNRSSNAKEEGGALQGGSLLLAVAGDSRELAGPAWAWGLGGQLLGSKWGDLGSRFLYDLLWAPGHEGMGSSCVTSGK